MKFKIRRFEKEKNLLVWENFYKNCNQSTFLHSQNFISYHKNKFEDYSLIIEMEDKVVGLLPAAISLSDKFSIVSHPGITYGGILHQGKIYGELMINCIEEICIFYKQCGFKNFYYKPVPSFYHKVPAQDDIYALNRLNAKIFHRDLSSVIDLSNMNKSSDRRKRNLKKAKKLDVLISEDKKYIHEYWILLNENLKMKYDVFAVHSLSEINFLSNLFPENIKFTFAIYNNEIVAGVVLFITETCYHAQYISSNKKGNECGSLDLIFDYLIQEATLKKKRWFDFGRSTETNKETLNTSLYKFKNEFGAGGFIYEQYMLFL